MDRLDELIAIYLDGAGTETDAELTRLLQADPDRGRALIEEYRLHQRLQALYRPAPTNAVEKVIQRLQEENNAFVESVIRNISRSRRAGKASVGMSLFNWALGHRPAWGYSAAVAAGTIALALLVLAGWMFFPVSGSPEVGLVQGSLSLERGGRAFAANPKTRLQLGDQLATGPLTAVILSFGREKTRFDLGASTRFRVDQLGRGKRFSLLNGAIEAQVARQSIFRPLIIATPQAEVRVLGTRFLLAADPGETHLDVREGKILLTRASDGAAVKVAGGERATVAANVELAALPATGGLLREYWTNLASTVFYPAGSALNSNRSAGSPDGWDHLDRFQSKPVLHATGFVERIRGYVLPPTNGLYRFAITTLHVETALRLSRSDKPEEVVQVAHRSPLGGSTLDDVTPVPLQAGRKYYTEIVHESDGGDDSLTVMWKAPGREPEIIPGEFLSPFLVKEKKGKR